jgi:ABC-type uncharacterized transport system involved in gliding motility auxiliary subunit
MSKTSKSTKLFLFSALGVLAMGALLVAVNLLAGLFHGRLDLTENRLFTLSPGTAAVLQKMDTPVTVRFYYSRDNAQMPVALKAYAQRIEDLLGQYRSRSGGKVKVQLLNPAPDSDAEDAARLDGVAGQPLPSGDVVYLGAAISCLDQTVALPVLSPDRESLLEYDLTRAIYRVLHPEKPVLGLMSSLPISGQQQQMFMMPNAGGAEPPWTLYSELKNSFAVTEIPVTADSIPANVNVLLLIHPRDLSGPTLYALDQFVLRGGRLLAFLDPLCWAESKGGNPMSAGMRAPPGPSTLGKLLDAWGVAFDTEKIVADVGTMLQVQGRDGNPERMPALLGLRRENADAGDPALATLDSVMVAFGGAFTGNGAPGLKKTVLLSSSKESQMIEKFLAQMGGEAIMRDLKPDGQQRALAIRLAGTFKTAFPAGRPAGETPNTGDKAKPAAATGLKVSAKPTSVVLVGDVDLIADPFCVRVQNLMGQKVLTPLNDNLDLALNLAEQLAGDDNLLGIRGRAAAVRPFTVVARLQAAAERQYQEQIRQLEDNLAKAQQELSDLQQQKSGDQKFILSPDQQNAIAKYKQTEAESRRQLKQVRKQFRQEIDALETRVKWANIALVPVIVGLFGLMVAIIKKRRSVAR